jgi:predicted phosphodiesterase
MIHNRSHLATRTIHLLLSGCALLLAACQIGAGPEGPIATITPEPSATVAAIEVASPTSTATQVPLPTAPLLLEHTEVEYVIPLHVQHKTRDQLVLMFELDQAIEGRLYWWREGESHQLANSIPFDGTQSRHILHLAGLESGERYSITVGLPGSDGMDRIPTFKGEVWGPLQIKTLPDAFAPMTIGVFGDSGFGEPLTAQLATQLTQFDPDLILHTGDLVYLAYEESNPQAAYQFKWYQILSSLLNHTVIYPVVGNHEYDAEARYQGIPYYFHAFPMLEDLAGGWQEAPVGEERQWYALELGTLQILFLNTQQLYGGPAREAQDIWLRSRLVDTRFKATIVVFHVPPYSSGKYPLDGRAMINSWVPAFEDSNVALVLSGHDHNYQRLEHNGITYVISGGGSSVLYPMGEKLGESLRFEFRTHFVLLNLNDGGIQLEAYDRDGEMFDSTMIPFVE